MSGGTPPRAEILPFNRDNSLAVTTICGGLRSIQWAAAGFKDTLLRWKMKPEVDHGNEKAIQPRVQA